MTMRHRRGVRFRQSHKNKLNITSIPYGEPRRLPDVMDFSGYCACLECLRAMSQKDCTRCVWHKKAPQRANAAEPEVKIQDNGTKKLEGMQ